MIIIIESCKPNVYPIIIITAFSLHDYFSKFWFWWYISYNYDLFYILIYEKLLLPGK